MSWVVGFAEWFAVACAFCAGSLVFLNDRRMMFAVLSAQYVFVTLLTSLVVPIQVAAVKLVTGFLVCGILSITLARSDWTAPAEEMSVIPSGRVFRLIAILLVTTVSAGLSRTNWTSLPGVTPAAVRGSTFLIGLGLLQLGLSERTLRVAVGLLTVLSGFEIVYVGIEPSLAVLALLGAVHLSIAVVVSYLLTTTSSAALIAEPMEGYE